MTTPGTPHTRGPLPHAVRGAGLGVFGVRAGLGPGAASSVRPAGPVTGSGRARRRPVRRRAGEPGAWAAAPAGEPEAAFGQLQSARCARSQSSTSMMCTDAAARAASGSRAAKAR